MLDSIFSISGLSHSMWRKAVFFACYILKRVSHKKFDKNSFELWKGFAPNLNSLKEWGVLVKVGLPDFNRGNVGSKTSDTVFIGYAQNSVAYRFMSLSDHSICESRYAKKF